MRTPGPGRSMNATNWLFRTALIDHGSELGRESCPTVDASKQVNGIKGKPHSDRNPLRPLI